ncbi:MAG: BrnT family toxin [Pseudomonadota bacterium]|nr:BrnT family toxin [Pseudomonadota bacterium]
MDITFDAEKRALILVTRGLDFDDAVHAFAGTALTIEDDRQDYGETRYQTMGLLKGRLVVVVWTPRGEGRHIITMWKANDRERKRYEAQLE